MNRSRVLWLCNGGMVCVAMGSNLLPVYFTTFSDSFGKLGDADLGRIPAILFAGYVVGIGISGPLADRFGARIFAIAGFALSAIGLWLLSLAVSYHAVLGASGVIGLGAGVLDMVMSPIVSAVCVDDRASSLNRLHAFFCIGAVGAVFVASAGLWLGISWRWISAGIGLIPAILMTGFFRVYLPPLVHPDKVRQGLRFLLLTPRFYVFLFAIALAGATEAGMAQWLPAYAEQSLGYSKVSSAVMLAAFSIAMGTGRLAASMGNFRFRAQTIVGTAGIASAGLYAAGALLPNPPIALAACVMVGLVCSVLWPTTLGIVADRIPHGGASMFAMMAAAGNAGCLVVPWMEGIIAQHSSLRVALLAAGSCPLLLGAIMGVFWLTDRPLPTSSERLTSFKA